MILVFCAALTGCASLTPPDVALVGLAPLESTLLEPRMRLDFRLQNTGPRTLDVRGLRVALKVNGAELARGVDNHGFLLPELGETRTSVEVSTSLFRLAEQLLRLPDLETFTYELGGTIYLQGFPRSLPFRHTGSISREQLQRLAGGAGRAPGPLRLE